MLWLFATDDVFALFGSGEAFDPASKKLRAAVGISISGRRYSVIPNQSGVSSNTEPLRSIEAARQNTSSDLMIVEIDGTTSPQIKEIEGITARESLKQPTEYKECNVVVIEKLATKNNHTMR